MREQSLNLSWIVHYQVEIVGVTYYYVGCIVFLCRFQDNCPDRNSLHLLTVPVPMERSERSRRARKDNKWRPRRGRTRSCTRRSCWTRTTVTAPRTQRLNEIDFLERMHGKRLLLMGDSMNWNREGSLVLCKGTNNHDCGGAWRRGSIGVRPRFACGLYSAPPQWRPPMCSPP